MLKPEDNFQVHIKPIDFTSVHNEVDYLVSILENHGQVLDEETRKVINQAIQTIIMNSYSVKWFISPNKEVDLYGKL